MQIELYSGIVTVLALTRQAHFMIATRRESLHYKLLGIQTVAAIGKTR